MRRALAAAIGLVALAGCAPPPPATLELTGDTVACFTATERVRDVRVGPAGDAWVATEGGLLRYTTAGRLIDRQTRCDGLAGHTLSELAIAADGTLWIGSATGLTRLRGAQHEVFTTANGLSDDRVYAVTLDARGRPFVGTHRGVSYPVGQRFEPFNDTHEFSRRPTYDIHPGNDGSIWFAKQSSLTQFRGDYGWRTFQRDATLTGSRGSIVSNMVRHVVTDADGEPWVGTPRGLGHFDGDSWRHLFHNARMGRAGLQDNLIEALDRDPAGGLWVGHGESETIAEGGGLGYYDGARWQYYDERDGLPSNRVLRVRADRPDEVWVGTTRGAARLRDQRFTTFHTPGDLGTNHVLQIAADDAGRVVVLTTGGLALFDRGVRGELPAAPFASPRAVAWHDGQLWVGASDGLWFLDDGRWRRDTFATTSVVDLVSANDRLWVADGMGIRSGSDGQWRPERVGDPGVHGMFVSHGGDLWLSADGKRPGLTGLDNGRPYVIDVRRGAARARVAFAPDGSTRFVTADGIAEWTPEGSTPLRMPAGVEPRSVTWDADGRMWVGTRRSGLWRLDGPEWTAVQLHGRPFPHEIVELALESDDALWVGTAAEGAFRIALGGTR